MTKPSSYYAVIFTRRLTDRPAGYDELAAEILSLAEKQPGFIAFNSAADARLGISVSYWQDLESIRRWKAQARHVEAQRLGKSQFYRDYSVQVCRVEKSYAQGNAPYHPKPTNE